MASLAYHVDLTPDDNDTILVTCPDLPEVVTFGEDEDDALLRAVDAIETILAFRMDERRDIPAPAYEGGRPVHLPLLTSLKVELYRAMRAKGMRKSDIARAMRLHPPQVDRIFNLRHASRVDQIEAAFAALGMRVEAVAVAVRQGQVT